MMHHPVAENKARCPECAGLSSSSSVEKIFPRFMTAGRPKAGDFIYSDGSLLKRRSSRAGAASERGEGGEGKKKRNMVALACAHTATSTPDAFHPEENK